MLSRRCDQTRPSPRPNFVRHSSPRTTLLIVHPICQVRLHLLSKSWSWSNPVHYIIHQIGLRRGPSGFHWKDDVAFSQYLQDLFPTENHAVLSHADSEVFLSIKSALRATKLKKRLRVSFRATHDVRNHMYFDRQANVIDIYHHTAFIKEQLRATRDSDDFSTPALSIKAYVHQLRQSPCLSSFRPGLEAYTKDTTVAPYRASSFWKS